MIPYSATFRSRMVSRLVGPHAISATALSAESGLAQATLSRWLREASTLPVKMKPDDKPTPEKPKPAKQAQAWTPEEKLAVVLEAASLSEGELGVFLRSKGLSMALLEEWRQQALTGLRGTAQISETVKGSKRVKDLERELARKDKALAEAAALLILKKKVQAIWGDEDDDTDPRSDK
jgi:transposase